MGVAGRCGHCCGVGMETLHISELRPAFAASLLAGCEVLDPRGMVTKKDIDGMARAGRCFAATTDKAQAVYVVEVRNGVAWVSACKGSGNVTWSEVLLPVIEQQAKGCASVGFQTRRRGLVKVAQSQGYEITGWIMKKKLP